MNREEVTERAWKAITDVEGGKGYYGRLQSSVANEILQVHNEAIEAAAKEARRYVDPDDGEDSARDTALVVSAVATAIRRLAVQEESNGS